MNEATHKASAAQASQAQGAQSVASAQGAEGGKSDVGELADVRDTRTGLGRLRAEVAQQDRWLKRYADTTDRMARLMLMCVALCALSGCRTIWGTTDSDWKYHRQGEWPVGEVLEARR